MASHLLDIGGVGLVLGDSAFVDAGEKRAAFLVEQGDVFYQEHDNYEEAAAAYAQAAALSRSDYIRARMLYLKRRYAQRASDPRDYRNLFRAYPPAWMESLGPDPEKEKELTARLMAGGLGTYLMVNWYVTPLPDPAGGPKPDMDTAIGLFARLHEMEPSEPLYIDSLATLYARKGDFEGSGKMFRKLTALYPFGNEYACFRLAWIEFKLGRMAELEEMLARCGEYAEEAKYLTMKAALDLHKGHNRRAYRALSRSIKLDKAIGETHSLLAEYYRKRGDKSAEKVHLQWLRRNT
jgi:tetratricopeptide (TPR) repeat protein